MLSGPRIVGTLIIGLVITGVALIAVSVATDAADEPRAEIPQLARAAQGPRGDSFLARQIGTAGGRVIIPGVAANGIPPATPTPTVTPTPTTVPATATPTPAPATSTPEATTPSETGDPYAACLEHPDRYNWQKYAGAYDWPMGEVAEVVAHESSGDLCAINPSSGATCWFQIHPGGLGYLDPETCVAAAYAKWHNRGGSFAEDWYRHW